MFIHSFTHDNLYSAQLCGECRIRGAVSSVAAGAKPLLTYLYLVAVDVSDVDND